MTVLADRPRSDRMTSAQRLVPVLLLGSPFMLAVDFSILNVALPVIGSGLGFAPAAAGFTLLCRPRRSPRGRCGPGRSAWPANAALAVGGAPISRKRSAMSN
ncbi:hypothetical protein [Nonomuraea sp. NPDC049758]|uniref:hypothetical protein n=1 Tax=Nonomuraea sp. NPDC049758 TaxID=3154360 RepID=UPI0034320F81